jgi:ParB-like chromosome segregation protein Spo0J
LILRPAERNDYEVVRGHNAYEAACRSQAVRVFCLVREPNRQDPLDALAELRTIGGRDPIEEADALQTALKRLGLTQRQLSKLTGVAQPHISKRLRLLDLTPRDQALVRDGRLTIDEALDIARSRGHKSRRKPRSFH